MYVLFCRWTELHDWSITQTEPTATCRQNPWLISALVKLSNQVAQPPGIHFCSPRECSCGVEFREPGSQSTRLTSSPLMFSTSHQPLQSTCWSLVSGTITGGLWAIMGPSGSGKDLCALSLRLDLNRMTQSGEIRMNGKPYGTRLLKGMSGFVMPRQSAPCPLHCSRSALVRSSSPHVSWKHCRW